MKLMLIHLSDIHITSQDDAITGRHSQIVDAVKNLDYSLDACVVVVTGDIAFAGTLDQYVVAMDFLDKIKALLTSKLSAGLGHESVPVHLVVIPGNHDCDFQAGPEFRETIINSVLSDYSKSESVEIVEVCTSVQESFFTFLKDMETLPKVQSNQSYDMRLCYEYDLSVANVNIKFLCYNTAWLSRLRESQGQLFLPANVVATGYESFDLVVAAFHHPYNWIESNAARLFRDKIESAADLILTGHEHVSSLRGQEGLLGRYNLCVEGGVLQENNDPEVSEFNAFIFDTTERQHKFGHFKWEEGAYHLTERSKSGDDGGGLAWASYRVNDSRFANTFQLSPEWQDYLDDPGVSVHHRDRGPLKLQDVFLYPDLMEVRNRGDRFGRQVAGNDFNELVELNRMLLITGDTESGKTCLGKVMFLDLLASGLVPVFLEASDKPPGGDRVHGFIESIFAKQYSSTEIDSYRRLDRSCRALIIDDYDKLSLSSTGKKDFLDRMSLSFGRIIVLAHDVTSDLEELTNPGGIPSGKEEIAHYRIQPLGYVGRNKLVERWMLLGDGVDPREITFVQNLNRITDTLNTLVGKNYVPSYPVYVLSVLQASDAATPVDITASTHGYFYELFIRASLARGRSSIDFDIIASYLAYLAYQLRARGVTVVSESDFADIHKNYEAHYDINRSFETLKRQLVNQTILVAVNDGFKFKYNYLYNYFVASYLKDHITEPDIRTTIKEISRALHIESNANILMFLAHLSKDPVIIDELLTASRNLYPDYRPAKLQDDIDFLSELGLALVDPVYQEQDPKLNREAMLEEMDRTAPPDRGEAYDVPDEADQDVDVDDPTVQLITSLRQLEISGQILKNFPGSLEGSVKLDIARECYNLGLRSLSVLFEMIQTEQSEILRRVAKLIAEREPTLTTLEIENRAKEFLSGLIQIVSYGVIKSIAKSVGSRDLSNTFVRLLQETETPAFILIDAALGMDIQPMFPEIKIQKVASQFDDDQLPLSVLRHLVVAHFQLFPVDYRTKQKICQALSIEYSKLQRSSPSPRIVPRPTRRALAAPRSI